MTVKRPDRNQYLAQKMVMQWRASIARKTEQDMLVRGSDWRCAPDRIGKRPTAPVTPLRAYSKANLAMLRATASARTWDAHEKAFVARFYSERLWITHATPRDSPIQRADGSVSLFSRKKLLERGVAFHLDHTEQEDIATIASDDHVFFSLEAGAAPQKPVSRFGDRLLRFEFDQAQVAQHASLYLLDPYARRNPRAGEWLAPIRHYPDQQIAIRVENRLDSRRHYHVNDLVLQGADMKQGLALSIIQACRKMPAAMKQELLTSTPINQLINGLFRPTVMVPRHFFDKPVDTAHIVQLDVDRPSTE